MGKEAETIFILHACDYAASYKGNFIDSLKSLEKNNQNVKNIYLFPHKARITGARKWIEELNETEMIAYTQEETFLENFILIRQIIKKHNIKFIFRHFSDYKVDIIIKLLFDSKYVIRFFHSMYDEKNTKSLKHKLRKFIWKKNTLVGVSAAVTRILEKVFVGFPVHTVENAICFERLQKEELLQRSNRISLLAMGYNLNIKGTDLALNVANKLCGKYNVQLYIIVAAHKEELLTYIDKTFGCVPTWVTLLPAVENIATYYNNTDIFLSPSRNEAFGYAVVEAAYCEKSIVASRVGGQAELDVDGVYWFESENLNDLYDKTELAIQQLQNPEIVTNKEKVKEYVQNRYSLDRWSEDVIQLIMNEIK